MNTLTAQDHIRTIQKADPTVTYDDIAAAVGVAMNTVARWAGGREPEQKGYIDRLAWISAQARRWYLRVMPAILLAWTPGAHLEKDELMGKDVHDRDFIGDEITVRRHDATLLEYIMTPAVDLIEMTFSAIGPDRLRVRLAARKAEAGGSWVQIDRRRIKSVDGRKVSLFVRFTV